MRLTNKIDNYYHIIHNWSARNTFEDQNKEDFAIHKLGQLEDIEDELGIDLLTLFKALKNGIYVKEEHLPKNPIRFIPPSCLVFDDEYLYELKFCRAYTKLTEHSYPFEFKDYGKTWALTKEELL